MVICLVWLHNPDPASSLDLYLCCILISKSRLMPPMCSGLQRAWHKTSLYHSASNALDALGKQWTNFKIISNLRNPATINNPSYSLNFNHSEG